MNTTRLQFHNASGDAFVANLHLPDGDGPFPVVVVCHGFKAFKEWGFFPHLCDALAAGGWAALRFNFSHCGVSGDGDVYDDLPRFAHNTVSQELEDVAAILAWIVRGGDSRLDPARIALLGHSRGGGVALLTASMEPRIRTLVGWNAVSTFERFGPDALADWRRAGVHYIENRRTKQMMPMDVSVLADMEANRERYDIIAAVSRLSIPVLFVQGAEDFTVPPLEMKALAAAAAGRAETRLVAGADHTFNSRHPMKRESPELAEAIAATRAFLTRLLRSTPGATL